jgi:hypothetical protein
MKILMHEGSGILRSAAYESNPRLFQRGALSSTSLRILKTSFNEPEMRRAL